MSVKYRNPPLVEFIIGVHFEPVHDLKTFHVGQIWNMYRDDFPVCREVNPINQPAINENELALFGRYFFDSSDETHLIQMQRDMFMVNWRKRDSDYPHYEKVSGLFQDYFEKFAGFIRENITDGPLNIRKLEISYTNAVQPNLLWQSANELQKLIPSITLPSFGNDKLDGFHLQYRAKTSSELETLVSIRSGRTVSTGEEVLVVDLKAEGLPNETDRNSVNQWYSDAHEHLGQTFKKLFDEKLQQQVWQRID